MKYIYEQDPGHGWLRVQRDELIHLGIANQITHYSYLDGEWAYLEEDFDMGTFLDAKQAAGESVEIESRHVVSTLIRGYRRYP